MRKMAGDEPGVQQGPLLTSDQSPRSARQAESEDRSRFGVLFETILNRSPDEATIRHHLELLKHQSWAEVCLGLAESEEARRRGRPTSVKPTSIMVVLITRDLNAKARKIIDLLQPSLRDGDHLTVVDRSRTPPDLAARPRLSLLAKPGATVFECRAVLAQLGLNHEWVGLVEDHDVPVEGWMTEAEAVVTAAGPNVELLSGAVDNRQSTDFWSWCSYLTRFGMHRPPMRVSTALPGVANVLIRNASLPRGPYRPGQFEIEILPALARNGQPAPNLVVDRVQHVTMENALRTHANNARVMGALTRRYVDDPFAYLNAIESGFTEQRALNIEQVARDCPTPYPLPSVMDGVRLLLKTSFVAFSMGMVGGPGPDTYDVD